MTKSPLLLSAFAVVFAAANSIASKPSPPAQAQLTEEESQYYRLITLPAPEGVTLEAGALCFLGPDRLACSTRHGDIWIAEGVLSDPPTPKWTQFASGLHEVLGLAVRPGDKEGSIYATQRGEVTRLRDTNGDGRADLFETVGDPWGISGNYHEYAFGSKFDKAGDMWVVLCLTGSFTSESPYRGWCFKLSAAGKWSPICTGIRSPGGIGFNAAGDLFYTDNQGPWNGACKLQQIRPGAFLGHPGGLKWFDEPVTKEALAAAGLKPPSAEPESGGRLYVEAGKIPELLPPSIYFPYPKLGQSTSGFAFDCTGKFGPFKDQLFVGDQTQSIVSRVFLEKVNDHYQGACFPFRQGFDSGCLALEFASDASLFVYGTDRGWGARGGKPFALQRLVWTGRAPFEIHEMRSRPDGFEFTFTEPIDEASAKDTASYQVETYTYIYQSTYGSPEVDRTEPVIKSIVVGADKRSVRVVLDALAQGHVHEFHLTGVKSATGQPLLHDAAYYTLFYIPTK